ncbi:hypothetical protein WJX84_005356 [Apatococcus fuscideae]|uniref:NADP-dependent oxidoreductase domain-containing protein n=1 Tax=Apatococcus fuscideae TaxID=2026836 RepID=A0AAW1ST13_9CHLO
MQLVPIKTNFGPAWTYGGMSPLVSSMHADHTRTKQHAVPLASAISGQHASAKARRAHSHSAQHISRTKQQTGIERRHLMLLGGAAVAATQLPSSASGLRATAVEAELKPASVPETVELGKSGLQVSPVGVGAWSWGDRSGYWGYNKGYGKEDNLAAFKETLSHGISFIDTAEVYGFGLSEEFLGEFMRTTGIKPVIATKFAPLPWRLNADSVVKGLKGSLSRLGVSQVGLYMQHWPGFLTNAFSNDAYVEGLGRCVQQGLTQAVGVSNYREDRIRKATARLADMGVPLASNQVQYSLLYRAPESNGVAQACKESGTTLVAYSPLSQGLLTGKYSADNRPGGARAGAFKPDRLLEIEPLLSLMRDIGSAHGGKSPSQIAINWTLCKGALPIPGVKTAKQAREAAGSFGWRMTNDQVAALDKVSARIPSSQGAPFEKW